MNISQLFSLQGRTALVTGGSRGIGRMIAEGYLRAGARVYISARKAEACDATAQELAPTAALDEMAGQVAETAGETPPNQAFEAMTQDIQSLVQLGARHSRIFRKQVGTR